MGKFEWISWIFKTSCNLCLDHFKRIKNKPSEEEKAIGSFEIPIMKTFERDERNVLLCKPIHAKD